jgi:TIGR00299 family protein
MKICYLDAFSGISGDMTIGALLDAGADCDGLIRALESLGLGASFSAERTKRKGITATKFHITGGEAKSHRHLSHILKMIDAAPLPDAVKETSTAVFQRIGEVEAAVHGIPIEKVHFHEVGAVDSICDVVGACWSFHSLGIQEIYCSPINVGSGTVETDHGTLPVPAPATAALLIGKPIYSRGPQTELATPTGAAIAATLSRGFGPPPPMKIRSIGYGSGTKDFKEQANVLRVLVGEDSRAPEAVTISVLEANVDDATPEVLGYTMDRLFEAGALDVTLQPLLMKKSRPGVLLRALTRPEDQERIAALILRETTTLGLRIYAAERRIQPRRFEEVETRFGKVRMKISEGDGAASPEYDDCRKLALETNTPLKTILAEATYAYLKQSR